ncbi:MAG: alanine racemase, partial [Acidobacteriota bacterium]|nr:alanine racemase [Acidobacteriota bacterium]
IEVTGVYTQFANAKEPDDAFVPVQLSRLLSVVDKAGGRGGLTLHSANSAAVLRRPETHLDRVRPGLAVYGYDPADGAAGSAAGLRPCLRLVSRLSQIKQARPGEGTGYGLSHVFSSGGRLGLVPVGYADGYRKGFSGAIVRIAGYDAEVLGAVSMDWIVVDLTAAEGAQIGDQVEIFSTDPADPHSVEALARWAGTISHEVCSALGERVHRRLVD